jgi:general secretion pathway protein A
MYYEFYGLREAPFGLTPDPRFVFRTEGYEEVMANLKYGIQHCKGIIAVVGEVGTGKTTTLRSAIQQFGRDIACVYLFNPYLTSTEFFELFASGLSLGLPKGAAKPEIINALGRAFATRHSKGFRTVLIVDEAQGLSTSLLEEIRLLANFETNSEKLLQIILCGQPELRQTLNLPGCRQLKQRISLRCTVRPLPFSEIEKYIRFRLKIAGAERVDLFDAGALKLIGQASIGIPRIINNICDNALLYGYAAGARSIDAGLIEEVIETLDLDANDPLSANSMGVSQNAIGAAIV